MPLSVYHLVNFKFSYFNYMVSNGITYLSYRGYSEVLGELKLKRAMQFLVIFWEGALKDRMGKSE